MSKSLKFVTILFSFILLFNLTTHFSEAASTSTAKTIATLKAQVKKLTASNKEKDKLIRAYKSQLANKIDIIKQQKNWNLEKSKFDQYTSNNMYSIIDMLIKEQIPNYQYDFNQPEPQIKETDITIHSRLLEIPNFNRVISNTRLKQIVVDCVRSNSYRNPYIKVNKVIIEFPTKNIIIPINESI